MLLEEENERLQASSSEVVYVSSPTSVEKSVVIELTKSPAIHVTAEVSQEASRSAVVGPQIPEGTQATSDDVDSAVVVELEKKVAAAQEAADASSKNLEEVSVSLEKTNASLADANFSLLEIYSLKPKSLVSLTKELRI